MIRARSVHVSTHSSVRTLTYEALALRPRSRKNVREPFDGSAASLLRDRARVAMGNSASAIRDVVTVLKDGDASSLSDASWCALLGGGSEIRPPLTPAEVRVALSDETLRATRAARPDNLLTLVSTAVSRAEALIEPDRGAERYGPVVLSRDADALLGTVRVLTRVLPFVVGCRGAEVADDPPDARAIVERLWSDATRAPAPTWRRARALASPGAPRPAPEPDHRRARRSRRLPRPRPHLLPGLHDARRRAPGPLRAPSMGPHPCARPRARRPPRGDTPPFPRPRRHGGRVFPAPSLARQTVPRSRVRRVRPGRRTRGTRVHPRPLPRGHTRHHRRGECRGERRAGTPRVRRALRARGFGL